jgi:uncharacterized membrane-anchored protein YhcB (DUF1043 family)
MAVAIIAALGTVVVALIGFFAQRIQARDARAKVQRDLDLLSRLEPGSSEHQWLKSHIQRSIFIFVEFEEKTQPIKVSYAYLLLFFSAIMWIGEIYLTRMHYLKGYGNWFVTGIALIAYFAGMALGVLWIVRGDYIQRVDAAENNLKTKLEEFQSTKKAELVVPEAWVKRFWEWLISAIRRTNQGPTPTAPAPGCHSD